MSEPRNTDWRKVAKIIVCLAVIFAITLGAIAYFQPRPTESYRFEIHAVNGSLGDCEAGYCYCIESVFDLEIYYGGILVETASSVYHLYTTKAPYLVGSVLVVKGYAAGFEAVEQDIILQPLGDSLTIPQDIRFNLVFYESGGL